MLQSVDNSTYLVKFEKKPANASIWKGSNTDQGGKKKKQEVKCSHCHREGHEVDSCFFLHGFPSWYSGSRNLNAEKKVFAHNAELETPVDGGNQVAGVHLKTMTMNFNNLQL
ncbi:OLC1v1013314C1 [Oldenlandia corymbosa var. corymbosa]|uniref:OLC1v1013314C1 n=1 Tax=Oldenlandia corymbosa var. corymbosa TaxID=529605 RepID=A0AAV1DY07_OLDCO|nr:OLC1v1013314C1 [Oldenlandia corymbosa var. corymbosa]